MRASAFFRLLQMAAATIALATGSTAAVQAADSAVILQYHRFGEAQLPTTSVTIDQLEAHIEHLVRGDYVVLPVPEIVATLRARRPLPDRTIGITIDDAARTVIEEAWPRFEKAGFPFTVFVSTDAVDEGHTSIMNWDELRRLVAAGVTIGNHGSAHARMWRHDDATNSEDILKASRRIKDELGVEPVMFAFPYGEWNRALRTLVSTLGFSVAFGQQSGAVHADADFLTLPRFPLN
jgi:peptidoglycan/xylan/chitin deacetylase (PgdA/CDA1 family)